MTHPLWRSNESNVRTTTHMPQWWDNRRMERCCLGLITNINKTSTKVSFPQWASGAIRCHYCHCTLPLLPSCRPSWSSIFAQRTSICWTCVVSKQHMIFFRCLLFSSSDIVLLAQPIPTPLKTTSPVHNGGKSVRSADLEVRPVYVCPSSATLLYPVVYRSISPTRLPPALRKAKKPRTVDIDDKTPYVYSSLCFFWHFYNTTASPDGLLFHSTKKQRIATPFPVLHADTLAYMPLLYGCTIPKIL